MKHQSLQAEDWRIQRVPASDRRRAMGRLMGGSGQLNDTQAARLDAYIEQVGVDVENLWAGYDRHGRIGPVALIVPRRGRTGMVFISRPANADQVQSMARVIDAAAESTSTQRVRLLQTLVDPGEDLELDAFQAGGFDRLACLHYLQRVIPTGSKMPDVPDDVELRPYRTGEHDLFIRALDASYEQTLDCPSLRGVRQTEDVLEGHRATGQFEPDLWTLLLINGRPLGTLLLNPVPEHGSVELVYLGLAPAARGRGLGGMLLRRGLAQCASRRERVMRLAVDEDNCPAMGLYRNAGFIRVARKQALVRTLNDHTRPQAS